MGFLSHKISRDDLKVGDHIYSWRTAFVYAHHGIYVGDGKVIHFTCGRIFLVKMFASSIPSNPCLSCGDHSNLSGVMTSCLNCFLAGGNLYLFEYSVSPAILMAKLRGGTCTTAPSEDSEQVITRARYLLLHNGFGKYHVLKNNCENFAVYCKTSLMVDQNDRLGRSGQASLVSAATGFTFMVNPLAINAVRLYADIGVRKDAKKVPVESLVAARAREG